MTTRQTFYPSRARFIADENSITRIPGGGQINWANVSDTYLQANGKKMLPAGTPVSDEVSSGDGYSEHVDSTNDAKGILETDAVEGDPNAALSGYGIINGGNIFENLCNPAFLTGTPKVLTAGVKTALAVAGVGPGFGYFQYSDNRG